MSEKMNGLKQYVGPFSIVIFIILGVLELLPVELTVLIIPAALGTVLVTLHYLFGLRTIKPLRYYYYLVFQFFSLIALFLFAIVHLANLLRFEIILLTSHVLGIGVILTIIAAYLISRSTLENIGVDKKSHAKVLSIITVMAVIAAIWFLGEFAVDSSFDNVGGGIRDQLTEGIKITSQNPGEEIIVHGELVEGDVIFVTEYETYKYDYRDFELKDNYRIVDKITIECSTTEKFRCRDGRRIETGAAYVDVIASIICSVIDDKSVNCNVKVSENPDGVRITNLRSNKGPIYKVIYDEFESISERRAKVKNKYEKLGYFERILKLFFGKTQEEEVMDEKVDTMKYIWLSNIMVFLEKEEREIGMNKLYGDYFSDGSNNIKTRIDSLKQSVNENREKFDFTEYNEEREYVVLHSTKTFAKRMNQVVTYCEELFSSITTTNDKDEVMRLLALLQCNPHAPTSKGMETIEHYATLNGIRWLTRNPEYKDTITIPESGWFFEEQININLDEYLRENGVTLVDENGNELKLISVPGGEKIIMRNLGCEGVCKIEVVVE